MEFDSEYGSYLTNPVTNLISPTSIANQEYNKNLQYYDHYKMFFQKAKSINNAVNLSGGGEGFDYSFGITSVLNIFRTFSIDYVQVL